MPQFLSADESVAKELAVAAVKEATQMKLAKAAVVVFDDKQRVLAAEVYNADRASAVRQQDTPRRAASHGLQAGQEVGAAPRVRLSGARMGDIRQGEKVDLILPGLSFTTTQESRIITKLLFCILVLYYY